MWVKIATPILALVGLMALPVRASDPLSKLIDQTASSITYIQNAHSACTGFVLSPNRIMTAAHCIDEGMTQVDGHDAGVVKIDSYYDLALLEAVTLKPGLKLRERAVERDEPLYAIGHAFGWKVVSTFTVHAFLIDYTPSYKEMAPGLFVLPAYVRGMSGGPVIDAQGQVVSVMQRSNEGVGFGVSTLIIRAFLLGS